MYQALYRKWRPQTFDEVIGQSHITETLKKQVETSRLSHAYIFIGTRGTGKTTCARILAKAVNCENPVNGNPCGKCASCRAISEGTMLDIVEMDAASNNRVDDVRALREEAVFSPTSAKKRVYIIDEVHMLSTSAFNALLKILEEPPEHLMFILATTELQKVPATILSRCQRHTFKRIEGSILSDYLVFVSGKENMKLTKTGADLIARLAEGGVRDALSLLDQCSAKDVIDADAVFDSIGLAGNRRIAELLEKILNEDEASCFTIFNSMWMDGKAPYSVFGELNTLLRDILMVRVAPKGSRDILSGGYDIETLTGFASRLTPEEIAAMLDAVQKAMLRMRDAQNPKTTAELCLLSLCRGWGRGEAAITGRLARLEERVRKGIAVQPAVRQIESKAEAPVADEPLCDDTQREEPRYSDEADDIDPAEFEEEQPEDVVFSDKKTETVWQLQAEQPEANDAELWEKIKNSAELPPEAKRIFKNENDAYGVITGSVLKIYAEPVFTYGRFNKPAMMAMIEKAASLAAKRELHVQVLEMPKEEREQRDLGELAGFPEVTMI